MARRQSIPQEQWPNVVGRLDDDLVRDLLVRAAEQHDDIAGAVRLAAAESAERIGVLRAEVDRTLRTRRFLDYRQSSGWARDAAPVVDALAVEVETDPSSELIALIERSVGHVIKVILHSDDSNGTIGGLASDLLELHARACDSGSADAVRLAKWIARFTFDDQDFFMVDPVRYRDALGDKGLATYRAEVAKRGGSGKFAVRYANERLAVLDGDVGRVVELFGGALDLPYHFERVAKALLELGLEDDAETWARRGIAETSGWQVANLFDLVAGILDRRGDTAGLFEVRRTHHRTMPSATTYATLKAVASRTGDWEREQAQARDVLAARDLGGLVDALLADGDAELAWSTARASDDWDAGPQRWRRLADARESTNPADAMNVYLHLAEVALVKADRGAYKDGIGELKHARRAAKASGLAADFERHVAALRELHRRRPTLIKMLDKADL